ncbi:protein FAM220A [Heterocephalus glaber]|uniref:Protein FAM220A n=1 Tax=Heterocephalus glaber TaxID=10181 RepID=A0AAX6SJL7_HETGA|nr:protein FAM220A [Heterocephalus glaber]
MRDRRRTFGTCTAKATGEGGEDPDRLPHSLERSALKGSPCPTDSPSDGDGDGDRQSEALSWEAEANLKKAGLLLPPSNRAFLYWKGSMGRKSAVAAVPSKAVGLSPVPASVPIGECPAALSRGARAAQQRDWPGGGPRDPDSRGGQCCRGEPCASAWPGHMQLREAGVSKSDPLRAPLEGPGSALELSCVCPLLLPETPHAHPQGLLRDATRCDHLDQLKPVPSEQTREYRNMLSSINCTSSGLRVTLGLLPL